MNIKRFIKSITIASIVVMSTACTVKANNCDGKAKPSREIEYYVYTPTNSTEQVLVLANEIINSDISNKYTCNRGAAIKKTLRSNKIIKVERVGYGCGAYYE